MLYNQKAIEISGTVIDAVEGTPLPDSHIYVSGTHIGAVSDENGKFSFQIPLIYRNRPLVASFVGYSTFEEKVSKLQQCKLQIALQPTAIALDEIIVMPGKELLVDQAIEAVLAEYDDQEEMLIDFYTALFFLDENQEVLSEVVADWQSLE